MRRAGRAVVALLAALVFSCSSAPKRQDEITDQRNRAAELARIGNDSLRKGDVEQALHFFTLALAYNGAVDNRAGIIESYNSIGKAHLAAGNNEEATRHFGEALKIAQALGDPSLIAKSKNNLGEAAFARGDFAGSLELFKAALDGGALKDADRAVVLHNEGSALRRLGKAAEAESLFRAALAINTHEKIWAEAASNYYMLASLASDRGDYPGALRLAGEALDADRKVENAPGIANDYMALGRVADRSGDTEAALGYYERAVFVYKSMGVVDAKADVTRALRDAALGAAQSAERLGRAEEARSYRAMLQDGGPSR